MKGEEAAAALVIALAATAQRASTSPASSSLQGNDNNGPCPATSHGSSVPNYAQFEDSDEEDEEVGSHSCMEDEASTSKFFFSSPMSHKGDEVCLLMHESHAHFSSQEGEGAATFLGSGADGTPPLLLEGVGAAAFLGRGADGIPPLQLSAGTAPLDAHPLPSPSTLRKHGGCDGVTEISARGKEQLGVVAPLLSAGTAPLVVPHLLSPSKPKDKEHGGCDGVTVVPARGKEKIGAVVPPIQLSAAIGWREMDVRLLPMLRKWMAMCSFLLQPMTWEIMLQRIATTWGNMAAKSDGTDPMQLESDAWVSGRLLKKRNGKLKMANDNAIAVTSLGNPVSLVGIDVDPLCGVTTRGGSRRTGFSPRSKG
ncbi:hypothetical protein OIU84_001649 [Salix udensis]|uniref:Uncharacterized protein n=1 Tax=Salix udensis TaxID=889485 RepID=A0AAD6K7A9_9ROSI|nr:hypothetical protein OIU84_001649 [Salix udensis]